MLDKSLQVFWTAYKSFQQRKQRTTTMVSNNSLVFFGCKETSFNLYFWVWLNILASAISRRSVVPGRSTVTISPNQTDTNMAGRKALEVYLDLLSQPCRAVYLFLKHNKIPHTVNLVALRKGEHISKKVNCWQMATRRLLNANKKLNTQLQME